MLTLIHEALQRGPLTFRDFMELALYHPAHGYYMGSAPRLGREGDFVTAPEMTSLFGELLTLQWIDLWQKMGAPESFRLVEAGAGSGRLAADILATAHRFPAFQRAVSYTILEISPDFRQQQQRTLEGVQRAEGVTWVGDLDELGPPESLIGVIFSNEFLDALPVHWVEQGEAGLLELGVAAEGNGLIPVALPPRPPLSPDHFTRRGIQLPVGMRTEAGLARDDWWRRAASRLKQGVLLAIDYGHVARDYYHPARRHGTLVGYRQHRAVEDPLAFPGEMDLTADVDFSALGEAGREAGLELLGFTTQAWFLMALGILVRLEAAQRNAPSPPIALRETVMRLLMPGGMGERFKVLAMGKGVQDGPLAGFSLNDQRQRM